jgi:hypothetical protein
LFGRLIKLFGEEVEKMELGEEVEDLNISVACLGYG